MFRNITAKLLFILLLTAACNKMKLIDPVGFETTILADSVVFAQIGDFGDAGDAELKVSELVKSWNPDFIISSGDNNYYDGEEETLEENISQYYGDYIFNYDAPAKYRCNGKAFEDSINRFFPTPGNHDGRGRDGLTPYFNFFTLPGNESYYKFIWGPVTFFSLNVIDEDLMVVKDWLEEEISLSTSSFNIVILHYPSFSEGDHGNCGYLQWNFYEMGADIIFSGHEHIYNRIEKVNEEQTYYIVNGLGGHAITSCGVNELPEEYLKSFCYAGDYGAVKVNANADIMILTFHSVSAPETAVDSIVIEK